MSLVRRVPLHRREWGRRGGGGRSEEEDLRDEEDDWGPVWHGHPQQLPPQERVRHFACSFLMMGSLKGGRPVDTWTVLLVTRLRPQDTDQRARLWKHLQSLLETYSHLRENDQSFLVEVRCFAASCTHTMSNAAFKTRKRNTKIQNLRQHVASHHNNKLITTCCPAVISYWLRIVKQMIRKSNVVHEAHVV